jgi:hypothetical protein
MVLLEWLESGQSFQTVLLGLLGLQTVLLCPPRTSFGPPNLPYARGL